MSIETSELGNGLTIVTDTIDSVETASLGIWVSAGARNESPESNGVSHMLKHMAFKGTARRSAYDIASEIEDVGGHLNAYTSHEMTVYHATVLKEHVQLALDIIADILGHSTYEEAELERERGVVLQEIGRAADTPEDMISDWFQSSAFSGQPLGRPVLGTMETVSRMSRRTLLDYVNTHYGSDRMILSAAGNFDPDRVTALAGNAFGDFETCVAPETDPPKYVGGEHRENRDLEQVHVMLGFEGIGYDDPDSYALAVLSSALGGGAASRLFQEVREKRGLVYAIETFMTCYEQCGIFGLYAGTGPETVEELLVVICHELARAALEPMDEKEIARARNQIKASQLMALESTSARAERAARQLHVFGRVLPVDEVAARIDAVSADDLCRVAVRVLRSRPTLSAIGPIQGLPEYESIRKLLA